ncbi:hypothetical protein N7470_006990 [Penicillium chermesinum]|nr:hypothetical protein N7470_006990 [Penicillium chermesinum]
MAPSIRDIQLDHHALSDEYAVPSKARLSAMACAAPQALWGADDERGTLNLLTEEVTRYAATEVTLGRSVSLKLVIDIRPPGWRHVQIRQHDSGTIIFITTLMDPR